MTLAAGTRLGPYEILAPLGTGGMGEVFRARDSRLGREVAVKVLPDDVADDPRALARFEREAKAVAALSHPNILALYDVGESNGVAYAVTELLQGQTLRAALAPGPLPVHRALEVAEEIAQALAAAHESGIVHRDLKPENVFLVKDGHVKLLDFGLARRAPVPLARDDRSATVTFRSEPGTVVGTVAYMSPEQVGGLPADPRSDIFALGSVLHEMLSGSKAFLRPTAAETMTAILREDPPALAGPPEVCAIVSRCLEKKPETRFQSAQDVGYALASIRSGRGIAGGPIAPRLRRRWTLVVAGSMAILIGGGLPLMLRQRRLPASTPVASLSPKRILVLPFENVTGDASLEAVGRMTADWISQGLLQTEHVEVVAVGVGSGSAATKPRGDLKALAAENGAGTVVSGAYYASGSGLSFQARMTDAATGRILFALEPVTGPRDQPMRAIDQVRQRIMGAAVVRFGLGPLTAVIEKPPLYDAFKEYIAGWELVGLDDAKLRQHLERAVELDPDFVVAKIRLAAAYAYVGETTLSDGLFAKLHESTERMTPVEQMLLEAQEALVKGRLIEAYQGFRNLRARVPRDTVVRWQYARFALCTNRPRECLEALAGFGPWEEVFWRPEGRYRQLSWFLGTEARARHVLGDHERELAVARLAVRQFPDMLGTHLVLVRALAALDRRAELDQALQASLSASFREATTPGWVMVQAAQELREHGQRQAALDVARRATEWYAARLAETPAESQLLEERPYALCLSERWSEAVAAGRRAAAALPDSIQLNGYRGVLAARAGDREGAESALAWRPRSQNREALREATYWRACIAAQLGEKDRAVALLHDAFELGAPLILACHADWRVDPLRGYPPFEELIRPKD